MERWVHFLNSLHNFEETTALICVIGMFIFGITWPFVLFFIGRRFDPEFRDFMIELFPLSYSKIGRVGWYSVVMFAQGCGRRYPPKTVYYYIFGDTNLWKSAPVSERILIVFHLVPGYIGVFAMIIYYIHKLFAHN